MDSDLDRRYFIKACGKTALAAATVTSTLAPRAALSDVLENAPRSTLVDRDGAPIRVASLKPHQTLVFNYPYVATPAMLIVLDGTTKTGAVTTDEKLHSYAWPGGQGPARNLVAYAAICAHALSYVGHDTSFLHYSPAANRFGVTKAITCCAHGSVYDPSDAARVLSGPAEFSLAAIKIAYDPKEDILRATGVLGTEIYKRFYKAFRKDLREEYGRATYRNLAAEKVLALPASEYSNDILAC